MFSSLKLKADNKLVGQLIDNIKLIGLSEVGEVIEYLYTKNGIDHFVLSKTRFEHEDKRLKDEFLNINPLIVAPATLAKYLK